MSIVTQQEHLKDLATRYRRHNEDVGQLDAAACLSRGAKAFSDWTCCPEHQQLSSRSLRFSEEAEAYPIAEGAEWCVPLSPVWWKAHGFQYDKIGPVGGAPDVLTK